MNYTSAVELTQFVRNLKELNKTYSELSDLKFFINKGNNEDFKKRLAEAGQLIINFYDNYFVQKYSKSHDLTIRRAGIKLANFADLASNHIEEGSYFAIQYLLTEPRDRIKSSNNLKRLILSIEGEIRNRKKISLSAIA